MKSFDSLIEEYIILRGMRDALGFQIANKLRDVND